MNPARQLLGGGQRPLGGSAANPGDGFSVFDISADCKNPVQKSDVHLAGSLGHTGQWAPDGMTYYITPLRNTPSIIAVNVDDPTAPSVLDNGIYTFSAAELVAAALARPRVQQGRQHRLHHDVRQRGHRSGERIRRSRRQRLPAAAPGRGVPRGEPDHLGRRQRRCPERTSSHHRREALRRDGGRRWRRSRREQRQLQCGQVGQRIPATDRHLRSGKPGGEDEDPARRGGPRQLHGDRHRPHHRDPGHAGRRRHPGHHRAGLLRSLLPLLQRGRRGRREDPRLQLLRGRPALLRHPRPRQRQGDGVLQAAGEGDSRSFPVPRTRTARPSPGSSGTTTGPRRSRASPRTAEWTAATSGPPPRTTASW